MRMYDAQKAKSLFIKLKYQKFQASISKWDVLFKNDQMLWFVKKPNEKLQRFVIIFLWEVIYVHFYNWDKPLDLVLIVYDLIELIILEQYISFWDRCLKFLMFQFDEQAFDFLGIIHFHISHFSFFLVEY